MHRTLRRLLDSASGENQFVVAVNLDIRGFSDWSRRVESAQATLYLAKIYPKIIDRWFGDGWFFKPTGDGLLLVRPFVEEELPALVDSVLRDCLQIVEAFGTLCQDEPMVNFEVPQEVGIGVAQGAASRLRADDKTLDYSGRVLNLASRLMELARPRGVVVDAGFGNGLVPDDLLSLFARRKGYIRGVSPDEQIEILYVADLTEIPNSFSTRPGDYQWHTTRQRFTLRNIEQTGDVWWRFELDHVPVDSRLIKVTYAHDSISAARRRIPNQTRTRVLDSFEYRQDAGQPVVRVDLWSLVPALRKQGMTGTWEIDVKVDYPV